MMELSFAGEEALAEDFLSPLENVALYKTPVLSDEHFVYKLGIVQEVEIKHWRKNVHDVAVLPRDPDETRNQVWTGRKYHPWGFCSGLYCNLHRRITLRPKDAKLVVGFVAPMLCAFLGTSQSSRWGRSRTRQSSLQIENEAA